MPADRLRAYHADGRVLHEMDMPANGPAKFTADEAVEKVVFYAGPLESEAVVGSIEIGHGGAISVGAD